MNNLTPAILGLAGNTIKVLSCECETCKINAKSLNLETLQAVYFTSTTRRKAFDVKNPKHVHAIVQMANDPTTTTQIAARALGVVAYTS